MFLRKRKIDIKLDIIRVLKIKIKLENLNLEKQNPSEMRYKINT